MKNSVLSKLIELYPKYKQQNLFGRYITLDDINPLIDNLKSNHDVSIEGKSFLNNPIYSIKVGNGSKKILIWSQMHGNESTGTKAIFDLLALIDYNLEHIKELLSQVTLLFVPMLNPDGAYAYTRVNAQMIDLNRDAVALKAPESVILRKVLNRFNPDYCFNLHDQRTIFSVGDANYPATISLLAPSESEKREITPNRKRTMEVIVGIHKVLKEYIPNQIGRYTDEFYPTATGDNFQKDGFPTILIEAGHYMDDYQREMTRKFNFIALLSGILHIANDVKMDHNAYFKIPNNKKAFFDLIYTNIIINGEKKIIGIIYKEILKDKIVVFKPSFKTINNINSFGYNSLNTKEMSFKSEKDFIFFLNEYKIV